MTIANGTQNNNRRRKKINKKFPISRAFQQLFVGPQHEHLCLKHRCPHHRLLHHPQALLLRHRHHRRLRLHRRPTGR